MNRNKFTKYFLISLFIVLIFICISFIGIKGIHKGKSFLLTINNQLVSISNDLKSLENMYTPNENDKVWIGYN